MQKKEGTKSGRQSIKKYIRFHRFKQVGNTNVKTQANLHPERQAITDIENAPHETYTNIHDYHKMWQLSTKYINTP